MYRIKSFVELHKQPVFFFLSKSIDSKQQLIWDVILRKGLAPQTDSILYQ